MDPRATLLLGCTLLHLLACTTASDCFVTTTGNGGTVTVFSDGDEPAFNVLCSYPNDLGLLDRLEWLKDGVVQSSSPQPPLVLSRSDASLADAGEYSCRAVLTNGTMCSPVVALTLNVVDVSQIMAAPNQYVLAGNNLTMQCSSPEALHVILMAVDTDITTSVITNAQIDEEISGNYEYNCGLFFTGGVSLNRVIQGVVIVPPMLMSQSLIQQDLIGGAVPFLLTASFQSRTRQFTSVTWTKLGTDSLSPSVQTEWTSEDYGQFTTELVFSSLSRADSGTYTVSVSNNNELVVAKERTVTAEFSIAVTVPPARPTALAAVPHNTTHYYVTWELTHTTEDEQAASLELNILNPSLVNSIVQIPSPTSEEFYLPIHPGNDYEIALSAENVDGNATTDPVLFTIPPADPLVSSVKIKRVNGTAILVTLDLLFTGGGDITTITLSWTNGPLLHTDQPRQSGDQWTGTIVSPSLSVLEYSDDIEFTVIITNEQSMFTSQTTFQSFIAPGAPTSPVSTSIMDTSFTAEVQLSSTGTQPQLAVVLELSDRNRQISTFNTTGQFFGGETVQVTATGLVPGYQYTVTAHAVNSAGRGPDSVPATVNTIGESLAIPMSAVIGLTVVGSVMATVLVVFLVLCCVYLMRKYRKTGQNYSPKDYKDPPVMRDNDDVASKASTYFSNGFRGESPYEPRSPILSNSRASSVIPQTGTSEYSYEESEVDIVLPSLLHKKQPSDLIYNGNHYVQHYPPPLNLHEQHILATSGSVFSPDDLLSPPATALSFATDV